MSKQNKQYIPPDAIPTPLLLAVTKANFAELAEEFDLTRRFSRAVHIIKTTFNLGKLQKYEYSKGRKNNF